MIEVKYLKEPMRYGGFDDKSFGKIVNPEFVHTVVLSLTDESIAFIKMDRDMKEEGGEFTLDGISGEFRLITGYPEIKDIPRILDISRINSLSLSRCWITGEELQTHRSSHLKMVLNPEAVYVPHIFGPKRFSSEKPDHMYIRKILRTDDTPKIEWDLSKLKEINHLE